MNLFCLRNSEFSAISCQESANPDLSLRNFGFAALGQIIEPAFKGIRQVMNFGCSISVQEFLNYKSLKNFDLIFLVFFVPLLFGFISGETRFFGLRVWIAQLGLVPPRLKCLRSTILN